MRTNDLIKAYINTNLVVDSVYSIKIALGTKTMDTTTSEDVCGFVIPLEGEAVYRIREAEYCLAPGTILHAGPGMPLSKVVGQESDWVYILVHYKVICDGQCGRHIKSLDYAVDLSEIQNKKVVALAKGLLSLHKRTGLQSQLKMKMLLYQFVDYLLQAKKEKGLSSDKEKVNFVKTYIRDHMNQVMTISELADLVDMTDKSFAFVFNKIMGISPKKYLISTKIKRAESLMLDSELTMSEIAEEIGYEDPLYFSRVFKKYTGQSPTAFKAMIGKSPY